MGSNGRVDVFFEGGHAFREHPECVEGHEERNIFHDKGWSAGHCALMIKPIGPVHPRDEDSKKVKNF